MFFCSVRIRTFVAMASYIFHKLIVGKVVIDNFSCLNGDIRICFTEVCIEHSSVFHMNFVHISHLIGCQGDIQGHFA